MILVAGETPVDLISRHDELRAVPGGGPYNVARTVARLGRHCAYVAEGWCRRARAPVTVVDTIGAGDSSLGAVLSFWEARKLGREQLREPDTVVEAVQFGIGVSAITCGRVGAEPPRHHELSDGLRDALTAH